MFQAPLSRVRPVLPWLFLSVVAAYGQIQGMLSFDNRNEGTHVHPNASRDLTVIAIQRNFQLFPRHASLKVRFFLPALPANSGRKVSVLALERQDSFHYFMQSLPSIQWNDGAWNVFGPWPTKDVIDPLGLRAENIAVLALYKTDNGRTVYLPADVYQDEGQLQGHAYTFVYATDKDLQSVVVSVSNASGKAVNLPVPHLACNKNFNADCVLSAAGSTHTFDLNMSSLPQGEYHLKLLGHVPEDPTPVSQEIVFYHHP